MTTMDPKVADSHQNPLRRRLNLGDMAIMVGFAALFCLGIRFELQKPIDTGWTFYTPASSMQADQAVLLWPIAIGGLLLLTLSAMTIVLRLRRPRPVRVELMRQPGWIACFVTLLAAIWPTVQSWINGWITSRTMGTLGGDAFRWHPTLVPDQTIVVVGVVVGVSWLVLALSGQWRAEPSWVDRLGRLIGASWLLLLILRTGTDLVLALVHPS